MNTPSAFASSSRSILRSISAARTPIAGSLPARSQNSGIKTTAPTLQDSVELDLDLPDSPPADISSTQSSHRRQIVDYPDLNLIPPTHKIHTATLQLQAHHPYPLDLYSQFALHSATSLNIPTSNLAYLPTRTSLFTVPKSPFVHKKSQENFHRKVHKRCIKVYDTDREVLDLWLRYLKNHGIGGVGMRAEVYEWVKWGQVKEESEKGGKQIEGSTTTEKEVKDAAEKLQEELINKTSEQGGAKDQKQ